MITLHTTRYTGYEMLLHRHTIWSQKVSLLAIGRYRPHLAGRRLRELWSRRRCQGLVRPVAGWSSRLEGAIWPARRRRAVSSVAHAGTAAGNLRSLGFFVFMGRVWATAALRLDPHASSRSATRVGYGRNMRMARPTTIRLPDEVLNELDRRARARGKDRATLLRELLQDALQRDTEDEVVASYRAGSLSLSQAASRLGTDVWSLFDILSRRGDTLSVSLEDWMDSGSSRSA